LSACESIKEACAEDAAITAQNNLSPNDIEDRQTFQQQNMESGSQQPLAGLWKELRYQGGVRHHS
jgi:hypothetical protein